MSSRNTLVRSLHDVGAAAWFGGSLMGAVALNGAARASSSHDSASVENPLAVAASGWARWSPVSAAAIGAHLVGGLGLVLANRDRVRLQEGVTSNTVVKTLVTAAAVATTAYSGVLGAHLAQNADAPAESATVPENGTPDRVARTQQQLRLLQWVTPVLTGVIVVLGAQQGEQQKPAEMVKGAASKALQLARR